jgi:hypothetical protein
MRVQAKWWLCLVVGLSAVACSGSKSGGSDENGSGGTSEQSAGSSGESKSSSSSGQAGKSGSSSTSSSSTGQAGHSSASDEDAGVTTSGSGGKAASGAAGSGSTPTSSNQTYPTDGNQLALCSMAQGDCNKGLACHAAANLFSPGRGFCSKICEQDSDCSGVAPSSAKYTCSTGAGTRTCELSCAGTDDTSCPSGLKCVETAAATSGARNPRGNAGAGAGAGTGGGNAGTPAQFRCRYPFETSPAWGPCGDGEHTCDKDLTCASAVPGRTGHCVQSCEMDADCKKPDSGSVAPTCATITAARGMEKAVKECVLDCSAAKDGCPKDTTCVDGPRTGMGMGMGMGMNAKPAYQRCE